MEEPGFSGEQMKNTCRGRGVPKDVGAMTAEEASAPGQKHDKGQASLFSLCCYSPVLEME